MKDLEVWEAVFQGRCYFLIILLILCCLGHNKDIFKMRQRRNVFYRLNHMSWRFTVAQKSGYFGMAFVAENDGRRALSCMITDDGLDSCHLWAGGINDI